jgi:hypothetical protein
MATVASKTPRRTRWDSGYAQATQGLTAAKGCGAPSRTHRPKSSTRPTFVLMQGLIYLILALGLSGCANAGPPEDTGNKGEPSPGVASSQGVKSHGKQPQEIPGVDLPGDPPEEIPGVNPSASAPPPGEGQEIPGVTPQPTPTPPASTLPAEATALLAEAVVLETAEIQANPPSDADDRLTFLDSLPSSGPDKVSSLKSYDWVSSSAAEKFDEALALIADR